MQGREAKYAGEKSSAQVFGKIGEVPPSSGNGGDYGAAGEDGGKRSQRSDLWVEEASEALEEAIYMLEEQVAAVGEWIDAGEERIGAVEKRVVALEKSIGALEEQADAVNYGESDE